MPRYTYNFVIDCEGKKPAQKLADLLNDNLVNLAAQVEGKAEVLEPASVKGKK
jgi:hypothetical protein